MKTAQHIVESASPFRHPAWRWYLAMQESAARRQSTGDAWIDAARTFIAARQQTTVRCGRHAAPDAAIQGAEQIYGSPDHRRAELEALLLTAMPLEEIALRLNLEPATVDAYANLFFHVRDRLWARDWIFGHAIGGSPENHFAGERERIWKWFAFNGGPLVLDVVMAVMSNRPIPPHALPANATDDDEQRLRLRANLNIAAMTSTSLTALTELNENYSRLTATSDGSPKPTTKLEVMQDFLELAAGRKRSGGRKGSASRPQRAAVPESRSSPSRRGSVSKKQPSGGKLPAPQPAEPLAAEKSSSQLRHPKPVSSAKREV